MIDARIAIASRPQLPGLADPGAHRSRRSSRPFALNHTSFPRRHHAAICRSAPARPGNRTKYQYDAANGLVQVSDRLGNAIQYELDVMGNRVGERTYDPGGALRKAIYRVGADRKLTTFSG